MHLALRCYSPLCDFIRTDLTCICGLISCDISSQWWCWMVSLRSWGWFGELVKFLFSLKCQCGSAAHVNCIAGCDWPSGSGSLWMLFMSCCASSVVFALCAGGLVGFSVVNHTGRRYEIVLFSSIWLLTCFLSKTTIGTVYCIRVT